MIVCIVENLWGFLIVSSFKIQHSRIQVFCSISILSGKNRAKTFQSPPPHSQHYWHDLMPHNRSNFVIMTQRQQLKSIAYFRAYKLTVGNWQIEWFSNPLKWYPIASWHGNYCICTVPEEFQPEFDRELIKSPRCNWRFWLHCLFSWSALVIARFLLSCVFRAGGISAPSISPSPQPALLCRCQGEQREFLRAEKIRTDSSPSCWPEWHHLKQRETCF